MRHKLCGQLIFRMKTTINNGLQSFPDGKTHLGAFGIMVHTNVIAAHEQRAQPLWGDHVAAVAFTRKHFNKRVANHLIVENLNENNN